MGTEYKVYKDSEVDVNLYESSCRFWLQVELAKPTGKTSGEPVEACDGESDHKLTVDEMLDLAVSIVGPLHWFDERPETIVDRFIQKLRARHFT